MADSYQIGRAAAILRPRGELDINARDDLRAAILEALDGPAGVTVDLTDVTFIDSEALGALIDGYNAAVTLEAGFRVVGAQAGVARVLTVSGAQALFDSAREPSGS
ncbi:STAS domain-containing protein [Actinoplanes sp. LDG1-06]|uniref:Anti-sigma factor antagonist n=1 Tax=Paractinoplanes ovalisporus TaxID=2810368 RepID=A0ABS2AEC1_9ACTN|nr:STAS domain-containing protein [Actinoplanes ovalisporus]MBM2618180.1 STAS domain-containing protein [Actinoplanes ovalisporus]